MEVVQYLMSIVNGDGAKKAYSIVILIIIIMMFGFDFTPSPSGSVKVKCDTH